MTRTIGQVIFALLIDTVIVALTGFWALRGITGHAYAPMAVDAVLCAFWLRVTWRDVDQWTGPRRR
jgi:hypothetical protein